MTQTTKAATKVAPKRGRKVVTKKAVQAKKPKEPSINEHLAAGVNPNRYIGKSKFVNGNRKPKIMLDRDVALDDLTTRSQQGFYELREAYAGKAFKPRGFDNGVLRDCIAAGILTFEGGQQVDMDGHKYLVDAEKPVTLKITAKGQSYGKTA